jgi:cbb3-type cytochrome oxidase maturation protein
MEIVFLLLPLALLIVGIAVAGFFWAVKRGQYDDMQTPAIRVLFDEQEQNKKSTSSSVTTQDPSRQAE